MKRASLFLLLLLGLAGCQTSEERKQLPPLREDAGAQPYIELVLRGPAPGGLPVDEIAWAVGASLLGAYRSDPSLASRMEGGSLRPTPRSPLGKIAASVCRRLDEVVR